MNIDRELAQLFREAGAAHHQAFAATNGDDPEWADWYARYLVPLIRTRFARELEPRALAADLEAVDVEYRAARSSTPWPEYYAAWLGNRYHLDTTV